MAKKKSTSQYYKDNPDARKKRLEYQREYNKKASERKKRSELVKKNRDAGTYGNGDKKDYDHAVGKMVPQSKNRGRKSGKGTKDANARGGKKKGGK